MTRSVHSTSRTKVNSCFLGLGQENLWRSSRRRFGGGRRRTDCGWHGSQRLRFRAEYPPRPRPRTGRCGGGSIHRYIPERRSSHVYSKWCRSQCGESRFGSLDGAQCRRTMVQLQTRLKLSVPLARLMVPSECMFRRGADEEIRAQARPSQQVGMLQRPNELATPIAGRSPRRREHSGRCAIRLRFRSLTGSIGSDRVPGFRREKPLLWRGSRLR